REPSTTTSASAANSRARARAWSSLRSSTTLRLSALKLANSPAYTRMGSPPGGSTFNTSAPSSARSWVAYGPGRQIVKSRIRSPSSRPTASGREVAAGEELDGVLHPDHAEVAAAAGDAVVDGVADELLRLPRQRGRQ